MNKLCSFVFGLTLAVPAMAQTVVEVSIDAESNKKLVSPYIYGKNGCVSDKKYSGVLGDEDPKNVALAKEAGLRFVRMNDGNNATKYNWKDCLSSHPDWYNNVYYHNWNASSMRLRDNLPDIQAMYAFQLAGYVAKTDEYNFNDYEYNGSKWWNGVTMNLAGGGDVSGEDGDYRLYLKEWPADSTVAILDYWEKELYFDMSKRQYWSMDNEPEIWNGTHDDLPLEFTADEFIEKYIAVAKKAKALNPNVKLCGPVAANEWQWFKFREETLKIDGRYYCWLEYFIKRVADEQKKSGVRLLDVFDLHWYPTDKTFNALMGLHRVFFDEEYSYSKANGLKTINGGWEESNKKEMIFTRVNGWLDEHFGEGHGITLALTETAFESTEPTTIALTYASFLGTFMENGVEIFSPWTWKTGMWETLHLFSRYSKELNVSAVSDNQNVSAYTTVNQTSDSMTVIFVNRSETEEMDVNIDVKNFTVGDGVYKKFELSELPSQETFVSHEQNALKVGYATVAGSKTRLSLPAKSITALVLSREATGVENEEQFAATCEPYPNPTTGSFYMANYDGAITSLQVFNAVGQCVCSLSDCGNMNDLRIDLSDCASGVYYAKVNTKLGCFVKQIILKK